MEKVRIGVVGAGNISDVYLKNCIETFEILEVAACASLHLDRAQAKARTCNIQACTVDELLEDPSIEIILNLTVPDAHAEISLLALDRGKSVYSEKPLAITREDGLQIIRKAKERGLLVGCAPDTFLGGGLQTCRKLIDDGWIGTPFAANALMLQGGPETFHPNPDFFYQAGGGPLMDMGPYYITALVSLLGPVKRVTGIAKITYPERTIRGPARYGEKIKVKTPTHVTGIMEFCNGVVANLITSFDLHYPYWESKLPLIQIFGSEGTLTLSDPNQFGGPVLIRRFGGDFTEMPLTHRFTTNSRGIGLADMAAALRSGRLLRASAEMAFHVLDIMCGILDSSRSARFYDTISTCSRPAPLARGLRKDALDI
jgi:predicted dehydrogenase